MAGRVYSYWMLLGPARWSGPVLVEDGGYYGKGIPIGRSRREAQENLRRGVDMRGNSVPLRGLHFVLSPHDVEYLWDPEIRMIRRLP